MSSYRSLYALIFVGAVLAACTQTQPPATPPVASPTSDTDVRTVGYVTDPTNFNDLPLAFEVQQLALPEVKVPSCVNADGPFMRYYTAKDSATNAVQFTTTIPVSNPGISAREPGYVYAGGFGEQKTASTDAPTMDFGFAVDTSNELQIFATFYPNPITGERKSYSLNTNLFGDLSLDPAQLDPPLAPSVLNLYSKIYPRVINSGQAITLLSWTTDSRVYLKITSPITVQFFGERSLAKTQALNSTVPPPPIPYEPIPRAGVARELVVTYTNKVLPVVSYAVSGYANAGGAQAMKAMATIGQVQRDPENGRNYVNPSGGQSFSNVLLSNLQFGTKTANGNFVPASSAPANVTLQCPRPIGTVTVTGNATTGTASISIVANKGLGVLGIVAPPTATPLVINARPGDAKLTGTITTKNVGADGSLLRVNYGTGFTTTFDAVRVELAKNASNNKATPAINCPAAVTTTPIENRVYIRALTGATEVRPDGFTYYTWTPTRNVLVQLNCTGNPALGAPTVTYATNPPIALVGNAITGTITFKNDGTVPLDWTVTVPTAATWLKITPLTGKTNSTATASLAFTASCTAAGTFTSDVTITNKNVPAQKRTVQVSITCKTPTTLTASVITPYNGPTQLCPRIKGSFNFDFSGVTGDIFLGLKINGFDIGFNSVTYTSATSADFTTIRSCNYDIGSHSLEVYAANAQGGLIISSAPVSFAVSDNRWTGWMINSTNNCAGVPGIALDLSVIASGEVAQSANNVAPDSALLALFKPGVTYTFAATNTALGFNQTFTGGFPRPFDGDPDTRNGRTGFLFSGITRVCGNPGLAAQAMGQSLDALTTLVPDTGRLQQRVAVRP